MSSLTTFRRERRRFPASMVRSVSTEEQTIEGNAYLCFPQDGSWLRGGLTTADGSSYTLWGTRSPIPSQFSIPMQIPRHRPRKDVSIPDRQQKQQSLERELQFALEGLTLTTSSGSDGPTSPVASNIPSLSSSLSGSIPSSPPIEQEDASLLVTLDEDDGVAVSYDIVLSDLDEGSEREFCKVIGRNGETCHFNCRHVTFTTENAFWGQRADLIIQKQLGAELVGKGCHVFGGAMKFSFTDEKVPSSLNNSSSWCW